VLHISIWGSEAFTEFWVVTGLNFGPPVTVCPPIVGYGVRLIRLWWYGNYNKKCTWLAAIPRYITMIYTIGCVQVFKAGYFFSRKHCHGL